MLDYLLLLAAFVRATVRGRGELAVENLLLRQQLAVLGDFAGFYNSARPHRTLGLETPVPGVRPTSGPIRARPVLSGLHHTYERAA